VSEWDHCRHPAVFVATKSVSGTWFLLLQFGVRIEFDPSKMAKKTERFVIDEDNPEWTAEDFARAKPFKEVFPEQYKA